MTRPGDLLLFRGTRGASGEFGSVLTCAFHFQMVPQDALSCSPVSPTVSPKIHLTVGRRTGSLRVRVLGRAGRQLIVAARMFGYSVDHLRSRTYRIESVPRAQG